MNKGKFEYIKQQYKTFFNLLTKSKTPEEFFKNYQNSKYKGELRECLQNIYRELAQKYHLQRIPIYLPVKYKIKIGGYTVFYGRKVKSIILYPVRSIAYIKNMKDKNEKNQLFIMDFVTLLRTFAHEIAHVYEIGKNDNPSHNSAFRKTEALFKKEITNLTGLDL